MSATAPQKTPTLSPHPPTLTAASLLSSPLMLGVYVSIFILLATILFVCAVYSCVTVSPGLVGGGFGGLSGA